MAVNEVVVNGVTELSLVNDTVSEETLLEGATAHDASGNQITGKVVVVPVDSELNAESENAIQNKAVVAGINAGVNEAKSYVNGAINNPNLIDNPDFSINQRGQTEYTGRVYCMDRWFKNEANTVRITDNGVQLVEIGSLIRQRIATDLESFLIGKMVTLTVLMSNGNLFTASEIFPDKTGVSLGTQGNISMGFYWDGEYQNIVFTAQEAFATIRSVKLELGSVATPFVPPNPATELAKCQRYFQRIKSIGVKPISFGLPVSTGILPAVLYASVPMRLKPTLVTSGASVFSYSTGATNNVTAPSDVQITNPIGNDNGYAIFCINVYGSYTLNTPYAAWLMDGDYIDLSADL